jgi:hypothetical protein
MNATSERLRELRQPLLNNLNAAVSGLGIYRTDDDQDLPSEVPIGKLRRGSRRRTPDERIGMITLIEVDGVLQWEEGTGVVTLPGRRLRRGSAISAPGEVVLQYKFEKLLPSQVGQCLENLDAKLTPQKGLRRLDAQGVFQPATPSSSNGAKKRKALLFIHGTFSNNDNVLNEINSTKAGQAFIARVLKQYDDVFAFDHYTLSVSPVLNALDLARMFDDFDGSIDVICHSRGGLVARWWLEAFGRASKAKHRVILVGAPLAGTSLIAPPRLRAALGLITNVGNALSLATETTALAVPILGVAAGLFKIITSIASLGEKTPLIDAAVAMIPGLAGQSRVGNSTELLRLRQRTNVPLPDYYAVRCNFESVDPSWAFWRRFRKLNVTDSGVDMIFEGDNDLVVDTDSMTDLFDQHSIAAANVFDFGTTDRVHHTNYFRQSQTIDFMAKSLKNL